MKSKYQEGAVWVEFLVASSAVLLSLFFLIPMLGKYMDVRHATESAARYAAWERTVWHGLVGEYNSSNRKQKIISEIENESNHRILSNGNSLIYGDQKKDSEQASFDMDAFHFYNNHTNSKYEELLEKKQNSSISSNKYFSLSENESKAPKFSAVDNGLDALAVLLNGDVPVEREGYYKETISISAKTPSWMGDSQYLEKSTPFPNDEIDFSVSNSILVDGWGAGGRADNIAKVRDMKAIGQEAILDGTISLMKPFYTLFKPFARELWDIDVKKVDVELLLDETHLGQY